MLKVSPNIPFGQNQVHFDRLTSTNEFAWKWLQYDRPPEGTVVLTDDQYKGKGQQDAIWVSAIGKNLTCTFIVYPHFLNLQHIYLLNKMICVSVAETIEKFIQSSCKIKWPNDLWVENKKLSGILIQNSLQGQSISYTIIGIGINVFQTTFPTHIKATSILNTRQISDSLESILSYLQKILSQYYSWIADPSNHGLIEAKYHSRLLGLQDLYHYKKVDTHELFTAKTIKVDNMGRIHLLVNGQVQIFSFKEIEIVL